MPARDWLLFHEGLPINSLTACLDDGASAYADDRAANFSIITLNDQKFFTIMENPYYIKKRRKKQQQQQNKRNGV